MQNCKKICQLFVEKVRRMQSNSDIMSCVVAGLRYYFRIYKYEYLGELMTSELHIASHRTSNSRDFSGC